MFRNFVGAASSVASFVLAAVWIAGAAAAQTAGEPPDLTGTWTGNAKAVSSGQNPYRPNASGAANFSDEELTFTFNVAEQHDERFSGTKSAGGRTETLIGSLRPPDYTQGVFLDEDGRFDFVVRDPTTIDLCYEHIRTDGRVVACYTLKRQ
ncbi:MAG: hypothetical protein U1E59_11240 [Amaricoccus sp.]